MTEPVLFELPNFAPARTREMLDDPRGWAGETVWYGERGSSPEARLIVMAKLPSIALGDGGGITATHDSDAAGLGINHLFDAVGFRIPREQLKLDMNRYLADHLSFDTWLAATVNVDGTSRSAFKMDYADGAAYVADIGDIYLIVVIVPAVDVPSVQRL